MPDFPAVDERRERTWTRTETAKVVLLYDAGCSIYDLEEATRIELRHVVIRLVRLMFGAQGCLDDENTAPLSGEAYSREDQQLMRGMLRQGSSLAVIAEALGRTQLGVGWKRLSLQIPTLSAELREEYAADAR
ncbi:hypothetical protein ACT3TS_04740 [Specibacter sp. AOP5-B1-6]|uniref:hypothetical protein n=1 Tax=Specibacter sp. AOP5-B1-6 TaxID=3457653 RepID=UPI00402BA054